MQGMDDTKQNKKKNLSLHAKRKKGYLPTQKETES